LSKCFAGDIFGSLPWINTVESMRPNFS